MDSQDQLHSSDDRHLVPDDPPENIGTRWDRMGPFHEEPSRFPLVNIQKTMEKTPCYEWENSLLISMVIFHMLVITRGYIYIYMFHIDTHTTSGFFTRFHQLQGLTHRQKTIELSHSNPAGFEPPVVRFLRYIPGWWWLEPWNFYDFPFSWEWSPQLTNSYFSEGLKPPTNNH